MSALRHPATYQMRLATPDDLAWITQLKARVYSPTDALPGRVVQSWYDQNPRGFWIVLGHDGRRCGQMDVLPLRPEARDAFLAGDMLERDIQPHHLWRATERAQVTAAYVVSVAIAPGTADSNVRILAAMLAAFPGLLAQLADPVRLEALYGIAASASGSNLMRHMGMALLSPAARRRDQHDLFRGDALVVRARAEALSRTPPSPSRP